MAVMEVSERFACVVVGQNRTTQRREPISTTAADPNTGLRTWLRQYAKDHPRWEFRRAYHDARAEGWPVNHKKIQRLWREEGLRVPIRRRRPESPWRNEYVESFNGRVRDECLSINLVWSLTHARIVTSDWKDEYNHHRPHSSLGYLRPVRYAATCTHQ